MTKQDDKYTDPELRTAIKEHVKAGDKGGKPGQWSARKAQMVAAQYKKSAHERGEEPYTTDKGQQDASQKRLGAWTEEEWQTSDGSANAKRADGVERRYLPKAAWESMTEEDKKAADNVKIEGGKDGKQFVKNTDAAKAARKAASEGASKEDVSSSEEEETGDQASPEQSPERSTSKQQADSADDKPESNAQQTPSQHEHAVKRTNSGTEKDDNEKDLSSELSSDSADEDGCDEPPTKKKKANTKDKDADSWKSDSKEADPTSGGQASASRLPQEGQKVHWRAPSGWCKGTVEEILRSEKIVNGRKAKASEDDPRIVVKSATSGKEAVHKVEAVYFDSD